MFDRIKRLARKLTPTVAVFATKNADGAPLPFKRRLLLSFDGENALLRLRLVVGRARARVRFFVDESEAEVGVSVAVPLLELGAELSSYDLLRGILRGVRDREISLLFSDGAIGWSFWVDPWSSSTKIPRWRSGRFDVVDALLGEKQATSEEEHERDVEVPMPEGSYAAKASIERVTVKRPRWFAESFTLWTIETPGGVPVPGKGESPHDIDEDAIYKITRAARDEAEAVAGFVESALRRRLRYGGRGWRPEGAKGGGSGEGDKVNPFVKVANELASAAAKLDNAAQAFGANRPN